MSKLNSKKIIATAVAAVVAFCLIFASGFFAGDNCVYADAESEGFYISDYQVNINVTKDRVYSITEVITCNFTESKHGIYRSIPTAFMLERADGSRQKMLAQVDNFDADTSWEYNSEFEGDGSANAYYTVRLGDADQTVIGEQTYTLSYDYTCNGDNLDDVDEFYFNIIGDGWNTNIEHVSFNITMPAAYDYDKVGFSMGYYGTEGLDDGELSRTLKEDSISGETLRTLGPGEALTIRMELPEGYFTAGDNGFSFNWVYYIVVLFAIISGILCFALGRDKKIVPVVTFEPPEGYNSLDVGVIDHLDPWDSDIISLLVYLADKGYLTIEPLANWRGEVSEKTKKFCFHKLRDYDGDNDCERTFLEGLFASGDSVTSDDLKDDFYETVEVIRVLEHDLTKQLVCRKGRLPIAIMMILSLLLMILIPKFVYGDFFDYLFMMTGGEWIWFGIGVIGIVATGISWKLVQRRTDLGVELAGQVRGFAEFIETAEKDRIEALIEQDPQSFYKIIPYAMALNVTDKWIKKFKGIAVPKPDWYIYDSPYIDGYIIGRSLGSSLNTSMVNMVSSAASSGEGGFSGGGSGGGGGGSW